MDGHDSFGVADGKDGKGDTIVDKNPPLDDFEDRGRRYGERSESEDGHGSRKHNTPQRDVRPSGDSGYDPVGSDEGDRNTYKRQKTSEKDLQRDRYVSPGENRLLWLPEDTKRVILTFCVLLKRFRNPRDSPERGRDYGNYRRDDRRYTGRDGSRGINKDKRRDNRRWQGSNKVCI